MSGHRVELIVSFWVGDEDGRDDAEAVVRFLEATGEALCYVGSPCEWSVRPWTVDGNDWDAKWGRPRDEAVELFVAIRERLFAMLPTMPNEQRERMASELLAMLPR